MEHTQNIKDDKKEKGSPELKEELTDEELSVLSGGTDPGVVTGEPGVSGGVVDTSPRKSNEHYSYPSYPHL
jgi:hypothetical protein